jgi:hypothetical protein
MAWVCLATGHAVQSGAKHWVFELSAFANWLKLLAVYLGGQVQGARQSYRPVLKYNVISSSHLCRDHSLFSQ